MTSDKQAPTEPDSSSFVVHATGRSVFDVPNWIVRRAESARARKQLVRLAMQDSHGCGSSCYDMTEDGLADAVDA